MCDNKHLINDKILAGEGLPPIVDGSSEISGIITENRGVDLNRIQTNLSNKINSGIRLDLFSQKSIDKKND